MKTREELNEFYGQELKGHLNQLEHRRKKVVRNLLYAGITMGVVFLLVLVRFWSLFKQEPPLLTMLFFSPRQVYLFTGF